ncbi:hypothetical protein GGTG_09727 [Gaeumannomyces tritici R3-111a-1]|uniref:Uncharacterized protein n=1 Tax=Gaeumannomyces tritici (strain R3-111a-1) TaxID=644352 RepID=J3P892_GAET3|nr:hypothetical protein GGTG_09727 [Gaeumannomyces tritici R3-111a-1]EJT72875.1 hypothetical protein GGTG_09727 [Gaeumannomyces tritici R3-111a-1]
MATGKLHSLPPKPSLVVEPLIRAKKPDDGCDPVRDVVKRPLSNKGARRRTPYDTPRKTTINGQQSRASKYPAPSRAHSPAAKYRRADSAGASRGISVPGQQSRREDRDYPATMSRDRVPGASRKTDHVPRTATGTGLGRSPEAILGYRAPGYSGPTPSPNHSGETKARTAVTYPGDRIAESQQAVAKTDETTRDHRDPEQALVRNSNEAAKNPQAPKQALVERGGEATSERHGPKQALIEKTDEATKGHHGSKQALAEKSNKFTQSRSANQEQVPARSAIDEPKKTLAGNSGSATQSRPAHHGQAAARSAADTLQKELVRNREATKDRRGPKQAWVRSDDETKITKFYPDIDRTVARNSHESRRSHKEQVRAGSAVKAIKQILARKNGDMTQPHHAHQEQAPVRPAAKGPKKTLARKTDEATNGHHVPRPALAKQNGDVSQLRRAHKERVRARSVADGPKQALVSSNGEITKGHPGPSPALAKKNDDVSQPRRVRKEQVPTRSATDRPKKKLVRKGDEVIKTHKGPRQVLASDNGDATNDRDAPRPALAKKSSDVAQPHHAHQEQVPARAGAEGPKQASVRRIGEPAKNRHGVQKRPVAKPSAGTTGNASAPRDVVAKKRPRAAVAPAGSRALSIKRRAVAVQAKAEHLTSVYDADAFRRSNYKRIFDGPKPTPEDMPVPDFVGDACYASDETLAGRAECAMSDTLMYSDIDDPNAFVHPVPEPLVTLTSPFGDFLVANDPFSDGETYPFNHFGMMGSCWDARKAPPELKFTSGDSI